MIVFVTGATGLIGSNVCEQLCAGGDEVRALYVRVDAAGATSTVAAEGEGTTLTVHGETSLRVGFDKVPAGGWLVGFWLGGLATSPDTSQATTKAD